MVRQEVLEFGDGAFSRRLRRKQFRLRFTPNFLLRVHSVKRRKDIVVGDFESLRIELCILKRGSDDGFGQCNYISTVAPRG
jgi:hypothetical protein